MAIDGSHDFARLRVQRIEERGRELSTIVHLKLVAVWSKGPLEREQFIAEPESRISPRYSYRCEARLSDRFVLIPRGGQRELAEVNTTEIGCRLFKKGCLMILCCRRT